MSLRNVLPGNPRLRLGIFLWGMGMIGVISLVSSVLPGLLAGEELPLPMGLVIAVSSLQSAALLGLAVWVGCKLAPSVGLESPSILAMVSGKPVISLLSQQWRPGLYGALLGGAGLAAFNALSSSVIVPAEPGVPLPVIPIIARILYGGVTEELLIRWGLMTALLWLCWRYFQKEKDTVTFLSAGLSIFISALLFGIGHLPYASVVVPQLTIDIIVFIVSANTSFGVLFGYLYWRHGLESAMIAHAGAHLIAFLLASLLWL